MRDETNNDFIGEYSLRGSSGAPRLGGGMWGRMGGWEQSAFSVDVFNAEIQIPETWLQAVAAFLPLCCFFFFFFFFFFFLLYNIYVSAYKILKLLSGLSCAVQGGSNV